MSKPSDEQDLKHRDNPEPGDYWSERAAVGVCVVVGVMPNHVIICQKKKIVDHFHWTWDLSTLDMMTKKDFADFVSYDTIKDKTWCSVYPGAHKWVLDQPEIKGN